MNQKNCNSMWWVIQAMVGLSMAVADEAPHSKDALPGASEIQAPDSGSEHERLQRLFDAGDYQNCLKSIRSLPAAVGEQERISRLEIEADCMQRLSRMDEAIRLRQSLWEKQPTGDRALWLAELQGKSGDIERALATLDAGLALPGIDTKQVALPMEEGASFNVPEISALLNLKASLLLDRGQPEDLKNALPLLNDALTFAPDFELAKRNLIRMKAAKVKKEDIEKLKASFSFLDKPLELAAEQCREQIAKIDSTPDYANNAGLLEMRARCFEALGDLSAAAETWWKLCNLSRNPIHLMHLALVRLEMGEITGALQAANNGFSCVGIFEATVEVPKSIRYPGITQEVQQVAAINGMCGMLLVIRNQPGDLEKARTYFDSALVFAPEYALVLSEKRNLK